jgi:hypothetical protein
METWVLAASALTLVGKLVHPLLTTTLWLSSSGKSAKWWRKWRKRRRRRRRQRVKLVEELRGIFLVLNDKGEKDD